MTATALPDIAVTISGQPPLVSGPVHGLGRSAVAGGLTRDPNASAPTSLAQKSRPSEASEATGTKTGSLPVGAGGAAQQSLARAQHAVWLETLAAHSAFGSISPSAEELVAPKPAETEDQNDLLAGLKEEAAGTSSVAPKPAPMGILSHRERPVLSVGSDRTAPVSAPFVVKTEPEPAAHSARREEGTKQQKLTSPAIKVAVPGGDQGSSHRSRSVSDAKATEKTRHLRTKDAPLLPTLSSATFGAGELASAAPLPAASPAVVRQAMPQSAERQTPSAAATVPLGPGLRQGSLSVPPHRSSDTLEPTTGTAVETSASRLLGAPLPKVPTGAQPQMPQQTGSYVFEAALEEHPGQELSGQSASIRPVDLGEVKLAPSHPVDLGEERLALSHPGDSQDPASSVVGAHPPVGAPAVRPAVQQPADALPSGRAAAGKIASTSGLSAAADSQPATPRTAAAASSASSSYGHTTGRYDAASEPAAAAARQIEGRDTTAGSSVRSHTATGGTEKESITPVVSGAAHEAGTLSPNLAIDAGLPASAVPATHATRNAGMTEAVGNPFQAMDVASNSGTASSASSGHSSASSLSAGYHDPQLGYVELKAHLSSDGVHASLAAATEEGSTVLAGHMPALHAWLHERQTPVESLSLGLREGGSGRGLMDSTAQGGSSGQQASAEGQFSPATGGGGASGGEPGPGTREVEGGTAFEGTSHALPPAVAGESLTTGTAAYISVLA